MIRNRHRLRASQSRRDERGLTLIELLLGLALLALLAAFLAGGLVFARRTFLLDRTADLGAEADAAVQTLSDLLASAVPVTREEGGGPRTIVYEGERSGVSFIGLGTGHAMRGGLHVIKISVDDGDLVADVTPTQGSTKSDSDERTRHVILLARVRRVEFGFFGSPDKKAAPAWRYDWSKAEALPLQVSCGIVFKDDRRPPPMLIVTPHQNGSGIMAQMP